MSPYKPKEPGSSKESKVFRVGKAANGNSFITIPARDVDVLWYINLE